MNKKLPVWLFLLTIWISLILIITFGFCVWHIDQGGNRFGKRTSAIILFTAKLPSLMQESFRELTGVSRLIIQNDPFKEINGFKFEDKKSASNDFILLSAYDATYKQSIVKLISVANQKVVYTWIPDIHALYQQIVTEKPFFSDEKFWIKSLRINHPLLDKDGSLIFHIGNIANNIGSALVKIDAHSKLKWVLNDYFHHGLEFDSDSNIWVACHLHGLTEHPLLGSYFDDAITQVSREGKVLFRKSIYDLLIKKGYRGLVWGAGPIESDPLHINDIQPALSSTKYWKKDDLLISLRHRSTVLLYRPSIDSIIWLKTGPWLNQHDADFIGETKIGVFGNDVIRKTNDEAGFFINGNNEEYIFDFSNGKVTTPYSQMFRKAGVKTRTQGRSDVMENGDLFVEDTDNGRLLLGNEKQVIWQFVERVDEHSIGAVAWSRIISDKEFKQLTFLHTKSH